MARVGHFTKRMVHSKDTILHFIQSQHVTITENAVDYFGENNTRPVWIENVETLVESRYDVAKCLDPQSPFRTLIKQLQGIPAQETKYVENTASFHLSLGGRISIVNRGTPSPGTSSPSTSSPGTSLKSGVEGRDMKLHFCVLQSSGDRLAVRAVLHEPDVTCCTLAAMLGLNSYTDSYCLNKKEDSFGGITGIAWAPAAPQMMNAAGAAYESNDVTTDHDTADTLSHTPALTDKTEPDTADLTDIQHLEEIPPSLEEIPPPLEQIHQYVEEIPSPLEQIHPDFIAHIADLTKDQGSPSPSSDPAVSEPNMWKLLRAKRITASMFGVVLRAIDKGRFPDHMYRSLMNQNGDLSHVAPIKWGNDNEVNAKLAYEKLTGVTVQASGLWLHSSGILGASPDGLLPDNKGIVEFKCPYSLRDSTVEHAIDNDPKFYLKKNSEGTVSLSKNHSYYHQIQGMLYIINREYCDFCIWTPHCTPFILRIEKDPAWEACLTKLIHFYFSQFLPRIVGSKEKASLYEGYQEVVAELGRITEHAKEKRVDRRTRLSDKRRLMRGEVRDEVRVKLRDEVRDELSVEERDKRRNEGLVEDSCGEEVTEINFDETKRESPPHVICKLPLIDADEIVKIAALTSSPFDRNPSKLWHTIREHKLTSSSFHLVLNAIKRNSYPVSLFKSIMSEYYMENTKVAKLTQANIVKAISQYEAQEGTTVLPSGIWLSSDGILGASVTGLLPDGQGIVDVRCLFKYKDIARFQDIIALNDPNFHLEINESGEVSIKKAHRIYPQIQGALHFSRRTYCDCITWTHNLYHVTRIEVDPTWSTVHLPLLKQFYVDKLFPKLCDKWGHDNVVKDLQRFGFNGL